MTVPVRYWWIGGVVVVILISLITWMGVREDERAQVSVGTSVVVLAPPEGARASVPVSFVWEVRAPVGSTATHTAIHWDAVSHSEAFGTDATPAASGYPNFLPDYATGSFALPRSFTGIVTFSAAGMYSYRAHAIVDGKHYWSPEYSVVVQ